MKSLIILIKIKKINIICNNIIMSAPVVIGKLILILLFIACVFLLVISFLKLIDQQSLYWLIGFFGSIIVMLISGFILYISS